MNITIETILLRVDFSERHSGYLLTTGVDPRVDIDALKLVLEFRNACNVFLREASKTYLAILGEEGISIKLLKKVLKKITKW